MAGTKAGGLKAALTNKLKHGEDFYAKIGKKGGQNGNTGGFASKEPCNCNIYAWQHIVAECAGYKGGVKSKRKPERKINANA